jgi:hypothetical protein
VKVGDSAEYKVTLVQNLSSRDETIKKMVPQALGAFLMEVTAKTEKFAKTRAILPIFGGDSREVEEEIDLTKPYSPTELLTNLFPPDGAQFEQVDSGTEKIKVGEKEYETSWTKLTAKGKDHEETLTYWTCRSGPFGGLVRAEATRVTDILGAITEWKFTIELSP